MTRDFSEVIDEILRDDPRYAKNAYYFVQSALSHTVKQLAQKARRTVGHITGQQFLFGFRDYALEQFGPMASTVFENWRLRETEDVGAIVFNLVEYGVLGKTDHDSMEDFKNVYSFADAFEKPFLPKHHRNRKTGEQ